MDSGYAFAGLAGWPLEAWGPAINSMMNPMLSDTAGAFIQSHGKKYLDDLVTKLRDDDAFLDVNWSEIPTKDQPDDLAPLVALLMRIYPVFWAECAESYHELPSNLYPVAEPSARPTQLSMQFLRQPLGVG